MHGARAGLTLEDVALLARLEPATPTAYHRLNPLTKAIAASAATLVALAFGGYLVPAALLGAVVVPSAAAARALPDVLRTATIVTLPLAIAVGLVSIFTRAGTSVLFRLGPFDATLEGLDFAAQVTLRLFVMAAALNLFGRTTEPRAFVADLERRGVSPRVAFALGAVMDAVPAMVERARMVRDAQRARGLDTEGDVLRRVAGVVPLATPVVIGALHEVETRSLALEARAFGRPGPRHLLSTPADSAGQQAIRWSLVLCVLAVLVAATAGFLPKLP